MDQRIEFTGGLLVVNKVADLVGNQQGFKVGMIYNQAKQFS